MNNSEKLKQEIMEWMENTIGVEITIDQFNILFHKLNQFCDNIIKHEVEEKK